MRVSLENCLDVKTFKNKDAFSETKCPYAHQLRAVCGPSMQQVVHSKESCALASQGVHTSKHRCELRHLHSQLKG